MDIIGAENEPREPEDQQDLIRCIECGGLFKTTQGLAGHRRLGHTGRDAEELEVREGFLEEQERAVEEKEAELAKRKQEIEALGPRSLGLVQCDACGAWFDSAKALQSHHRAVHPLAETVAAELGVDRERVNAVWTEACREAERRPDKSPEQIIKGFWHPKDREILRHLRAHNAAFRFAEEGD